MNGYDLSDDTLEAAEELRTCLMEDIQEWADDAGEVPERANLLFNIRRGLDQLVSSDAFRGQTV